MEALSISEAATAIFVAVILLLLINLAMNYIHDHSPTTQETNKMCEEKCFHGYPLPNGTYQHSTIGYYWNGSCICE